MSTTISFGVAETCELSLADATWLGPETAGFPPLADPGAAIRSALGAPREYPPLAEAVIPGDRVAVAIGRSVPCVPDLLRGAMAAITAAGVDAGDVTVVSAEPLVDRQILAAELGVDFVVHRGDDQTQLAMVGANSAGKPLRLNRALVEADFVLPIAVARPAPARGERPLRFPGVFPQFASRAVAARFHAPGSGAAAERRPLRAAEADEAGWLLGIGCTVGVVPAAPRGVAAVVAGDPAAVAAFTTEQFQAIWQPAAQRQGDLVVATVVGDAAEQTWSNIVRAIAAAERVLSPGGAIAVCSAVSDEPDRAFDPLVDADDYAEAAQNLGRSGNRAARDARILALALQRGPVYLRSQLPDDLVESLGMTPIASDAELQRFTSGREHCIVIDHAQRTRPRWTDRPQ